MKSLVKHLSVIQQRLNAPKSQFNSFGKYSYRNCEDIMTALKPFLVDVYVTVSDDVVMIGDRFYVKATATISDGENSITNTAFARESLDKKGMDASQLTGATSSYARKYALAGLFLIDDNKDADSHDNTKQQAKVNEAPAFALDDAAKEWIIAVKHDRKVADQIEDPAFKKFILDNIK